MESNELIAEYFGVLYELALPIIFLVALTFLLLPRLLETSKNPYQTGKAFFCYILEGVGVFLMSLSGIQTVINVLTANILAGDTYSPEEYLALLLIFSTGGFLFLWCDQQIQEIDSEIRKIPAIIYFFVMKTVGHLAIVFAALSMAWIIALGVQNFVGWWVVPFVLALYGSALCWLTASEDYKPWAGAKKKRVAKRAAVKRKR